MRVWDPARQAVSKFKREDMSREIVRRWNSARLMPKRRRATEAD